MSHALHCGNFAEVGRRFRAGVQKSQEHSSEKFLHYLTAIGKVLSNLPFKTVSIFNDRNQLHSVVAVEQQWLGCYSNELSSG